MIILFHPLAIETFQVVIQLLTELRASDTPEKLYELQVRLFQCLLKAEEFQTIASRNVIREARRQKPSEPSPTGNWRIEQVVADRAVRQLRCVGDALAWRFFRFERRAMIALAQNESPGPMTKPGLEAEIGEVQAVWEQTGRLALLHALTDTLRVADLTIGNSWLREGANVDRSVTSEFLLREVKANSSRKASRSQLARMQMTIDAINKDGPLQFRGDEHHLFRSSVPLQTHLSKVGDCLRMAQQSGTAAQPIAPGWIVSAACLYSRDKPRWNFDSTGRMLGLAPLTIFPFDPELCAAIVCDYLIYESVLGLDNLLAAFQAAGFSIEYALPPTSSAVAPDEPVLLVRTKDRGATLWPGALYQILTEHIELHANARAVRETVDRNLLGTGVVTFTAEALTWR